MLEEVDVCRARWTVVQEDAGSQPRESRHLGSAFNLCEVCFGKVEPGTGEFVLQRTDGGQQEQPFAVEIEASGRVEARERDEVLESPPGRRTRTGELAEDAEWLPESDQSWAWRHSAIVARRVPGLSRRSGPFPCRFP